MKKLFYILFLAPIFTWASHSIEMGTFYTVHNEPGYRYNLGGLSAAYEVGNSKGLKATGRLHLSNNSDLIYIRNYSDLRWHIPLENVDLIPYVGIHWTSHQVTKRDGFVATLKRMYCPIGVAINQQYESFNYYIFLGHMHAVRGAYTEDVQNDQFYGVKEKIGHSYLGRVQTSYAPKENIFLKAFIEWAAEYTQKTKDLTIGVSFSHSF